MNLEQIRAKAGPDAKRAVQTRIVIVSSRENEATGLADAVRKYGSNARVINAGSMGYPDLEPLLLLQKPEQPGVFYPCMTPEKAGPLLADYLDNDNPRPDLGLGNTGGTGFKGIPPLTTLPIFALQTRAVLRNCGLIDPNEIADYITSAEGYSGLAKALTLEPEEVLRRIEMAGLRGRGGTGYPAAEKWKACRAVEGPEKYLVCNALDSDPLAGTARLILESNPHSFLEGMLIAAYAAGISRCIICVEAGDSRAIELLERALEQMRVFNLLGENILDSHYKADIEIKAVPPGLVMGEETALVRFLEGKQAMPYMRPPYPASVGINAKPTLIHSLETLVNVALILQKGALPQGAGTKVISLGGDILHPYTLEVPLGTTLRSIIAAGGETPDGANFKAVQFGGPAGAFFTPEQWDLAIDFESLQKAGTAMGSGSLEVFAAGRCAVRMAGEKMDFLQAESCGKCVFCREGALQMSTILADISAGRGQKGDLELLARLGEQMREGCVCGLGRNAPSPTLSSLALFRTEFEDHMKGEPCQGH